MKVHGTDHVARPPHAAPEAQKVQQDSKKAAAQVDRETEAPDAAAQQTPEKTPGVIRLLEEGHFKGVADVRLRINFFDELSSRAHQAAQPVVDEQTAKLADAVATTIEETIAGLDVDDATKQAIEDAVAAFDGALQEGLASFQSQDSGGADALVASFEAQIDTLIANLSDLLIPQVDETPESSEPITAPDPATSPTTDPENPDGIDVAPVEITDPVDVYMDALTAIREAAEAALAELKASLTSALDVGELSEPSGNGGAYDKFLAIYHELVGGSSSVDEKV